MTEPGGQPPVLYEVVDGVAVISFNRPHRHNAMTDESSALFHEHLMRARDDRDVRVILVRGEGPSFCSGRDTASLGVRATGLSDFEHLSRSLQRKLSLRDIQKPVIAAVHGHAVGGGFEIALSCDIRVVATDARLSLPEINWGIMTDSGGSVVTTALAGPGRAKYLLMTGEAISGRQAHEWGLADFVTSPEELDEVARGLAHTIAARPPINVAFAKQLVDAVHGEVVRQGLRNELVALTAIYQTDDYREARAARREGRVPRFHSR
ncbi:MAG TPA: enoyl-CoA hydratase/isomerase family protein [Amycolatopsis sp.]|nr:enoyl-CoA hydratase/isomerase family protein [Amycolatopsis sp.]